MYAHYLGYLWTIKHVVNDKLKISLVLLFISSKQAEQPVPGDKTMQFFKERKSVQRRAAASAWDAAWARARK
jgi:hypothetical protein